MKKEHEIILALVRQYLEDKPMLRFGQALFNMGILNQEKKPDESGIHRPRDIHSDSDQQIISRIREQAKKNPGI